MKRATYILVLLIAVVYILSVSKEVMVPFVIALLIWYIIRAIRKFISRTIFVGNRLPIWSQNVMVFGIITMVVFIVSKLLASSMESFAEALPSYEANIAIVTTAMKEKYDVDILVYVQRYFGQFDFSRLAESIINSLSQLLSDSVMIFIYIIFFILEESTFAVKHRLLFFKDELAYRRSRDLLNEINTSFTSYITIKTFTSLSTAILSYVGMFLLGVDTPLLWAIIIFLLNYIPSVGSLVATTFPTIVMILQTGDLLSGLWVLLAIGTIQMVIGNFLEPRLMGNSLNISPLIVLLSLVAWGSIWGGLGMVLSVPIMVMLIIVFSKFESTKQIAILLSENGRVH